MPQLQSEAPHCHLERARDREGGSETAWCDDAPTIGEGSAQAGDGWWRELKKANKPPHIRNTQKWRQKCHFHSKVFYKIYSQDVFEEYIK